MTNALANGSAWLGDVLKTNASRAVTYSRGGETITIAEAIIGNTRAEVTANDGMTLQSKVRDYLIAVEDLYFGSSPVEPVEGDEIREPDGTNTFVFTVMPLGSEPAWHYSDPFRQRYRIHTKLTAIE